MFKFKMKYINYFPMLILVLLLAGCNGTSHGLVDNPSDTVDDYKLDAGDTINIVVYGEPDMTMKVMLDKNGVMIFPYIGTLTLKGKTLLQVSNELIQRLQGDYLLSPKVTVTIAGFRKFYISGEVKNPDGYTFEPGLTVEKSIALAGGFTDRAKRNDIKIRLSGSNQLLSNVDLTHSVHPGDVVIIGMGFF